MSDAIPSKTVTVLTAAKITELTTKFPNLGIDTFVHERDYNQMANGREELRQRFERACARITELESSRETEAPQQFRAMELLDMRGQWALTRAEPPVRVVLAPGETWRPAMKSDCDLTISKAPQS